MAGCEQEFVELPIGGHLGWLGVRDGRGGFRRVGGPVKLLKGPTTASSIMRCRCSRGQVRLESFCTVTHHGIRNLASMRTLASRSVNPSERGCPSCRLRAPQTGALPVTAGAEKVKSRSFTLQ